MEKKVIKTQSESSKVIIIDKLLEERNRMVHGEDPMNEERLEEINKKLEELNSLITREPEKFQIIRRVALLVKELIGDRSMRQASIDSGIAASYISGILNYKYLPSADILRKLASPDANPKNGVSLEDLMIAAGYQNNYVEESLRDAFLSEEGLLIEYDAPKDTAYDSEERMRLYHQQMKKHAQEASKFEAAGTGIIYKALAEKRISFNPVQEGRTGIRGYRPDMQLHVACQPILEWWIDFKHVTPDNGPGSHFNIRGILSRFMFVDAKMERKISLVLDDEFAFRQAVEYKDHLSYKGDLSVILIDLNTFSIVEEVYLAHYDDAFKKSEFYIG